MVDSGKPATGVVTGAVTVEILPATLLEVVWRSAEVCAFILDSPLEYSGPSVLRSSQIWKKRSSENVLSYEEKEGQNDILIKSLILVGLERGFHRIEILHFKVKKFAISCV